jgi:hypothetical protein
MSSGPLLELRELKSCPGNVTSFASPGYIQVDTALNAETLSVKGKSRARGLTCLLRFVAIQLLAR